MSHIQLSYSFLLFWSIFGEINWKILFLFKKFLSQKESQKYSERLLFSKSLKRRKARGKFGFGVNNSFVQSSKMGQLLTKNVFLHKMSHIQINFAFLFFWIILGLIHWKNLFLVQKVTISERRSKIRRKFVFLNKFEKERILRKIWICLNKFFDQTCKRRQIFKKKISKKWAI